MKLPALKHEKIGRKTMKATYMLKSEGRRISVEVLFKPVKTTRLRVFPDGRVSLTVPTHAPERWVWDVLEQKSAWIARKVALAEQQRTGTAELVRASGIVVILGTPLRIELSHARPKRVWVGNGDGKLYLQSPKAEDSAALERQLDAWWKKTAALYFTQLIKQWYPLLGREEQLPAPQISVKKMRTRWGSCNWQKNKINLNYYLFRATPACVEFVILHELAHLRYPKHDKDFYAFLDRQMPDWKTRKTTLDRDYTTAL
ncbi:MAG: SprT family zinc-dependent metalloprotease [Eubacteriales bacterium]